jgi:hypothetical protein
MLDGSDSGSLLHTLNTPVDFVVLSIALRC